MIGGLVQQVLGGALLRARMEARKAAFAAAAGFLVLGALTLAGAAGIVVLSARYGVIAGLLAGAGLLLLLAILTFLVGRRVPGADASPAAVQAEAVLEDVPAPGVPHPEAHSGIAALARVHDRVRSEIDGVLPPGSQGAVTALAASQLARRPVPTLAVAVALGTALGVLQHRRGRASVTTSAEPSKPEAVHAAGAGPMEPAPRARRPLRRSRAHHVHDGRAAGAARRDG